MVVPLVGWGKTRGETGASLGGGRDDFSFGLLRLKDGDAQKAIIPKIWEVIGSEAHQICPGSYQKMIFFKYLQCVVYVKVSWLLQMLAKFQLIAMVFMYQTYKPV